MFEARRDAGQHLGRFLRERGVSASIVLGLPRGGVPLAAEVAASLGLPLDVVIVRKLGIPAFPEVAMGAIGEGGVRIIDEAVRADARVTLAELAEVEERERQVLARRSTALRGDRPRRDLTGQTVLIVDDGIATGATASAGAGGGSGALRAAARELPGGRRALSGLRPDLG